MPKKNKLAKPQRRPIVVRSEAEARTEEIRREARDVAGAYIRLGLKVRRALDDRVPEALGLTTFGWMKKCFEESIAKIYRSLRIVKALKDVPEKQLLLLPEGNAYQLARLPEKMRKDEGWVAHAEKMPGDEFESLVEAALVKKGHPPTEPVERVVLLLPESLAITWKAAMERAACVHELDLVTKPGLRYQALEAILAHYISTELEVLKAEAQ